MRWRLLLEPVLTPLFRTWWRLRRPLTLGVRGIVCDDKERVLLVRHTYSKGWHFPGGGVEHGEIAIEALKRELAEEGGVETIGVPALVGCFANHANFPNDHVLLYRIGEWRPCAPKADHEIAERGFFALDALPAGVTKGTRRRIAEIFAGAPQVQTW